MKIKQSFTLNLIAITPIHIGSGETLERDFDFAVHDKRTWMLNQDAIGEALYETNSPAFDQMLRGIPPGKLLQSADFSPDSPLFRYVMDGVPAGSRSGSQLTAHVKTVFGRAYLPGSSVKGAIRTILARAAYAKEDRPLNRAQLNRNRSWAGQRIEQGLFGKDPNHDLLRALQISDSTPGSADALRVHNAQVFSRREGGPPIPLECIKRDSQFNATLTLDKFLLENGAAQRKLQWKHGGLLSQIGELANQQAAERLKQERNWYASRPTSRAAKLYGALDGMLKQLKPNQFMLQIGWGGGYDSKTLGPMLDQRERDALIKQYNLKRGDHRPGSAFPTSRRAVAAGPMAEATPWSPFGWVLVVMTPR